MIAQTRTDTGRIVYVPLLLDSGGQARRVWVPADDTRDAFGEQSPMMALGLCILALQVSFGTLIADARQMCRLVEHRSPTDKQRLELQRVSRYVADTLGREGENLRRLVEQPTPDDDVELDVEYVVVESEDSVGEPVELDDLLDSEHRFGWRILLDMLDHSPERESPDASAKAPTGGRQHE